MGVHKQYKAMVLTAGTCFARQMSGHKRLLLLSYIAVYSANKKLVFLPVLSYIAQQMYITSIDFWLMYLRVHTPTDVCIFRLSLDHFWSDIT